MAPSWMSFHAGSNSDDQGRTPSCLSRRDAKTSNLISVLQVLQLVMNFTENHKSTRRSLYNIMTALWLLPADNHDTQVMLSYTHASHTHEPYYSHQTCKTKLCIESYSTGLCDHVRNTRRYAHGGPAGAQFSEITDRICTPITPNFLI